MGSQQCLSPGAGKAVPQQPGVKGPEPASLRSCRQGICRQGGSPSIPEGEMCGCTGHWGHRLIWGVYHSPGDRDILGRVLAQGHSDTRVKAAATKPGQQRDKSHCRNPTGAVGSGASSLLHLSQPLLAAHTGNCSFRQKLPQHLLGTFPYIFRPASPKEVQVISGCQTCCHQTLHPSGTV